MNEQPPIELRYLRYFVAVAEEKGFRKAASRLRVSAAALSLQIKKLETLLGVRLFNRGNSVKPASISLTLAGETLFDRARPFLIDVEKALTHVKDTAASDKLCLRIGVAKLFGQSFIMDAIKAYRSLYPAGRVDWTELDTAQGLPAALENGRVHMGIVYDFRVRAADTPWQQFEHQLIMDSPVHAVMGARHPLAALERVPLATLAEQELLCLRHSWLDSQDIPALFQTTPRRPPNIKRVHGCGNCLITKTGGITLLSERQALTLGKKVVHRPIAGLDSDYRVRLNAVWRKHEASPQIISFLELLKLHGASPQQSPLQDP